MMPIALIASFTITLAVTPLIMKLMRRVGIVGIDVHKPSKPEIPEMCGLSMLIGLVASSITLLSIQFNPKILAFTLTSTLAAIIGIIDDIFTLKAKVKTALTIICFTPIAIMSMAYPNYIVLGRPRAPLIGGFRLTIVYWILLPFTIAVPANAINMMDTYNGVMSGGCTMMSESLLASSIILGQWDEAVMSAIILGVSSAFYYYNKYPAKAFAGDTGSLMLGAAIGSIAVLGRMEIVGITVLMPFIMNAFHSLRSIGGLLERREIAERPVKVVGEYIEANPNPKAPKTLANLMLRKGRATELELIKSYHAICAISSIMGVITAILMLVRI
jgi:UDP-N-acetylmuramyl pentapeptide phosphotransferase/UDP-N-acetylglucosamine-1-phosphate transferase